MTDFKNFKSFRIIHEKFTDCFRGSATFEARKDCPIFLQEYSLHDAGIDPDSMPVSPVLLTIVTAPLPLLRACAALV